ncbi:MAG: hypothetical protein RLZZ358_1536 [Bacteroidota bacterium]|jgi:hypothetical protein
MPLAHHSYLKLRIIVDSQRSTADQIEPQTFFSLVSGEKADNQKKLLNALTFSMP